MLEERQLIRRIRGWLTLFVAGLVLSGVTAFPLKTELSLLVRITRNGPWPADLVAWLQTVDSALAATYRAYPFLAYGTDWLGFGHLAIAMAFIGPWRDPVRNKWVIQFGLIACCAVVPAAFIAGQVRHIPVFWRLIDCSFGVIGTIPLLLCLRYIRQCETQHRPYVRPA